MSSSSDHNCTSPVLGLCLKPGSKVCYRLPHSKVQKSVRSRDSEVSGPQHLLLEFLNAMKESGVSISRHEDTKQQSVTQASITIPSGKLNPRENVEAHLRFPSSGLSLGDHRLENEPEKMSRSFNIKGSPAAHLKCRASSGSGPSLDPTPG